MNPILLAAPLGFPWQTADPFLFCVHHEDAYPRGNAALGPDAPLSGRDIGQDFAGKDGWRMYHGDTVPGFPAHPHRGFETVTIVRRGLIDHSDSLGATARFGGGDVQWLTAGRGIVHAEMFPLVRRDADNPLELFQIWRNLPAKRKMAAPHFAMLWAEELPGARTPMRRVTATDVVHVAGGVDGIVPPSPPPESWAADEASDVAIRRAHGRARASRSPRLAADTDRRLYFFRGSSLTIGGRRIAAGSMIAVRADAPLELVNGDATAELLLLQGRPIGEPVAQYGPFVMNTRTRSGRFPDQHTVRRLPWPRSDPVHPREAGRFARHSTGGRRK
jgi:redox-sensitive bicupin YhaK (pirin superfamily)